MAGVAGIDRDAVHRCAEFRLARRAASDPTAGVATPYCLRAIGPASGSCARVNGSLSAASAPASLRGREVFPDPRVADAGGGGPLPAACTTEDAAGMATGPPAQSVAGSTAFGLASLGKSSRCTMARKHTRRAVAQSEDNTSIAARTVQGEGKEAPPLGCHSQKGVSAREDDERWRLSPGVTPSTGKEGIGAYRSRRGARRLGEAGRARIAAASR